MHSDQTAGTTWFLFCFLIEFGYWILFGIVWGRCPGGGEDGKGTAEEVERDVGKQSIHIVNLGECCRAINADPFCVSETNMDGQDIQDGGGGLNSKS